MVFEATHVRAGTPWRKKAVAAYVYFVPMAISAQSNAVARFASVHCSLLGELRAMSGQGGTSCCKPYHKAWGRARRNLQTEPATNDEGTIQWEPNCAIWCEVCQLRIHGPTQWKEHVDGGPHKRRMVKPAPKQDLDRPFKGSLEDVRFARLCV